MTKRDKIGTVVLLGIFGVLAALYILTSERHTGKKYGFSDSPLVEQAVINQKK